MTHGQHANFVHDLVQMAKAFEELPQVKAELDTERTKLVEALNNIQRLELRLIDQANELAAAHEATRKAEVERDHAERMFLETDDRLNAFRNLVQHFRAEVETFDAAMAPQPEAKPDVTPDHAPPLEYQDAPQTQGQSDADPITAPTPASLSSDNEVTSVSTAESTSTEGVSVPTDPTQPTPATESFSGSVSQDLTEPQSATPTTSAPDTNALNSDAGNTVPASQPETPMQPEPPADDVGYHNEPRITHEPGGWQEWDAWCSRMNARYGINNWPQRPSQAAQ